MKPEKYLSSEQSEILSKIDAIVDEMNENRLKRWFNRNIRFPVRGIVEFGGTAAFAGALGGALLGAVVGNVGGAIAGAKIGATFFGMMGTWAGYMQSTGKNPTVGLDEKSYKQWQRERASKILRKREKREVNEVLLATWRAESQEREQKRKAQYQAVTQ